MWHWPQGRLEYFQFEKLREIAAFALANDLRQAERPALVAAIGLPFSPVGYRRPWRNYAAVFRLTLIASVVNGLAQATPVAAMLAQPGEVTSDEYFHFLAQAFTEPSPALQGWNRNAHFRYPLLFSLKYLLTKAAINDQRAATIPEIVGAYRRSGLTGEEEDQEQFIASVGQRAANELAVRGVDIRQARESLRVIAQISYLHLRGNQISVSLSALDAIDLFEKLAPVVGPRARDRDSEILRLADLFSDGITDIVFDYPNTVIGEIVESGFREGSKVKKTHVTIERNAELRREFFLARPTATCDVCTLDTAQTYPWTGRILDLHHLLPLSSGTRVEQQGTTFDDLVPVCPSCHRAIHRYYDGWLNNNARKDFLNAQEARGVYQAMRNQFGGLILHAQ